MSNLKITLSKGDDQVQERLKLTVAEIEKKTSREIELLQQKNEKLKQKLAAIKVSQSETDE